MGGNSSFRCLTNLLRDHFSPASYRGLSGKDSSKDVQTGVHIPTKSPLHEGIRCGKRIGDWQYIVEPPLLMSLHLRRSGLLYNPACIVTRKSLLWVARTALPPKESRRWRTLLIYLLYQLGESLKNCRLPEQESPCWGSSSG